MTVVDAPKVRMSVPEQIRVLRQFDTGPALARQAAGSVALLAVGPRRLGGHFVMVTSPRGARDVLGGSDGHADKLTTIHKQTFLWGENVFNLPHDRWLNRRRALQPLFTKRKVAAYAGHMAESAENLTERWAPGAVVDLDHEMRRLTLQVIGRSVFGLDLGDRVDELERHVRPVLVRVSDRGARPFNLPAWLPTPGKLRFDKSLRALQSIGDEAVAACRADPHHDAELVRLLLDATDPETGKPFTDKAIREELFVFLGAGHDTTATTLAYSLWQLGRHPALQERVAAEAAALGDRRLGPEDVAALPYTVQVLHEAMRLCPPAAAVARTATRDIEVDGHRVRAGANVIVGIYAMHRDPALWDRPEEFDPDRFAADKAKTMDRWQFIPFGAGPRSCIGDHFAMLEATLGLATIVRDQRIESQSERFPTEVPFTMVAGGAIPARVTPRR